MKKLLLTLFLFSPIFVFAQPPNPSNYVWTKHLKVGQNGGQVDSIKVVGDSVYTYIGGTAYKSYKTTPAGGGGGAMTRQAIVDSLNTAEIHFNATVTDDASTIAYEFYTSDTLTNAAAKLVSLKNAGTERIRISPDGSSLFGQVATDWWTNGIGFVAVGAVAQTHLAVSSLDQFPSVT